MHFNRSMSWPQHFAFLFILKVFEESGSVKARHLGIKCVWMVGWSRHYTNVPGAQRQQYSLRLVPTDVMFCDALASMCYLSKCKHIIELDWGPPPYFFPRLL